MNSMNLMDLTEQNHKVIVDALHTALANADQVPMLFELYDGREVPTVSETAVVTEFIRYVLLHQEVPAGWFSALSKILDAVYTICSEALNDGLIGNTPKRFYGIFQTSADLIILNTMIGMFARLGSYE